MERLTTLWFCGAIMLLAYVIIIGLIGCDLTAGRRKAKKRGEAITSDGLKRTIEKVAKYFNCTFAMSLVDCFQLALILFLFHFYRIDIIMIPWFTLLALGFVAYVEIKSIWEPANIKERKQQEDYRRAILALIHEYGGIEKVMDALAREKKDHDGNDIVSHEYEGDDN